MKNLENPDKKVDFTSFHEKSAKITGKNGKVGTQGKLKEVFLS